MACVYILYSESANRYYVGSCRDLDVRLNQHSQAIFPKAFTTRYTDWQLFLTITDLEYAAARSIEQHIKKMKSKVYIANLKKHPEIISKLMKIYA